MPGEPSPEDSIFVDAGSDWQNNACVMHGYGARWYTYALGYREAADIVVAHVKDTATGQDYLLYPIMFLYRHYLELAIKGIIVAARLLLDEEANTPTNHKINHWWSECRRLVERVRPNEATEDLEQIGRLIEEFCKHDAGSIDFRYPVTKEGEATLATLPAR